MYSQQELLLNAAKSASAERQLSLETQYPATRRRRLSRL
jgi:hypothetical protein